LGHECVGIDFSPASITYAIENAQAEHIKCTYLHQDIRTADYGRDYGLAMLIFGEFNTFRPVDARVILEKAYQALAQNAYLLLEVHTYNIVFEIGREPLSWYSSAHGLFSDHPHICLTENVWNAEQNVATTRFYVVDGASAGASRYAQSLQAYTNVQYQTLLEECGFRNVVFHPSLTGSLEEVSTGLMVIVCQKPEAG
jgi:hypothetical protein